ncbi:hypothetical protein BCR44DRAFT_50101 [Catenaria anguillulae PL171]|uniref:Uncharacterized protein n=1 Tax=Catenaria anguillulae PL171 TaxID=765915 RepID=A0A1Y2HB15_9FUNG|nr:hypothetical protein BCR44DRAFT_50101 [Catenaria anguillulae PL171]
MPRPSAPANAPPAFLATSLPAGLLVQALVPSLMFMLRQLFRPPSRQPQPTRTTIGSFLTCSLGIGTSTTSAGQAQQQSARAVIQSDQAGAAPLVKRRAAQASLPMALALALLTKGNKRVQRGWRAATMKPRKAKTRE